MAPGTSGDPRYADDDGGEDLRRIVDLIPQTIVVLDPDGKALYAWPETLRRIQTVLKLGLQRDGEFEKRWPAVLGTLLDA